MKYFKLIFAVFLLLLLVYSCKKNSLDITSPVVGNWKFTSEADTLFLIPQRLDTTIVGSSTFHGYINFQPDGTVYTSTSFAVYDAVFGSTIYFYVPIFIPALTDTLKYTIADNVITFTQKSGSSYKNSIIFIDNNTLVLSNLPIPPNIYKKTYYYSK